MTDEERLKKSMDRLNQNSHYGIMIDTEITNIVRNHIKRLEEQKMNATSVQVINNVKDMNLTIEKSAFGDTRIIMSVSTDDDTYEFNCSGPGCEKFLRGTDFVPSMYANAQLKKRDETIRNLKEENRELKKELSNWKKEASDCLRLRDEVRREKLQLKEEYKDKIEDLQHKYNLERCANEAQRRFFREYAGKGTEIEFNYAIGDDDETTYVIVDKEEYKALKNIQNNVKNNGDYIVFNGFHYTSSDIERLLTGIRQLEELKTPTNEEPSSRSDILDLAKKCVCGKIEQDYGTPESNFQLIADLWNQYLFKEPGAKEVFGIGPMDVAMMMALMKIARIRNGGGSGDSFVDLAGYAACGGEIWHSNKETNGDSN